MLSDETFMHVKSRDLGCDHPRWSMYEVAIHNQEAGSDGHSLCKAEPVDPQYSTVANNPCGNQSPFCPPFFGAGKLSNASSSLTRNRIKTQEHGDRRTWRSSNMAHGKPPSIRRTTVKVRKRHSREPAGMPIPFQQLLCVLSWFSQHLERSYPAGSASFGPIFPVYPSNSK